MLTTPDFVEFPKIARLAREIIVTEKIDGTNGVIYVGEDGEVLAGSRSQWIATRAKGGADNFGFASWVEQHADELRTLGHGRHYGEWWGSGIQRGYGLEKGEKRFSLFNAKRWTIDQDLLAKAVPGLGVVPTLYNGSFADLVSGDLINVTKRLESKGSVASPGFMNPEGVIVFHLAARSSFKYTAPFDDDGHKGLQHNGN